MFIVMHCGGMPFNGETIREKSLGGSESAAYYLARELAKEGHKVTLFTNSVHEGVWDNVQYRWAGNITDGTPLGDRYHTYAVATPHDLNITQRHPDAFRFPVAAKVSALWVHDVPLPQHKDNVAASMLNADFILAVSEWQRQRVIEVWGVNPDNVRVIGNGVDLSLFERDRGFDDDGVAIQEIVGWPRFDLLYSSRPERGLETLVRPGGIMEQLASRLPTAHLYVCSYDNKTAHMQPYYDWLYQRCEALPNVAVLGHLTKQELADVMRVCHLLTYPTVFSETSCITAMEAMAAGLPILSSYVGALPETCDGAGAVLLPLVPAPIRPGMSEAGDHTVMVDDALYVEALCDLAADPDTLDKLREMQRFVAPRNDWRRVAERLMYLVYDHMHDTSKSAMARHLMRVSDIYALRQMWRRDADAIVDATERELAECYAFTEAESWDEHYAKYYDYEAARGVSYGPENLNGNPRFEYVASLVSRLPAGSRVLDYGCAHGHYTVNLAQRFPDLEFVGVDITPSNIERARAWAQSDDVGNARFIVGRVLDGAIRCANGEALTLGGHFDAVIAAEVLEHVADPQTHVNVLGAFVRPVDHARMIITVPYGPWEAMGYEQHWPWRAHVHHFERADLEEMCGHYPHYAVTVISAGRTPQMEPIGSYVVSFGKPTGPARQIDYQRKLATQAPRQTLTVCMIVKDAEGSIRNAIKSVAGIADEFVIALDRTTTDDTGVALRRALHMFCPHTPVTIFYAASPTEIGFDEARNATIERAAGDWVLWMDADEVLEGAANLLPRLRHNVFNAYAIPHHHFSLDPAGLLKTDYPTRVFRNHRGIRFFGRVHEHPETGLNEGIQHVAALPDVIVAHYGYQNEEVRQGRFHRNLPLLQRDRADYPERYLGKFLWLRDLFQSTQYDLQSGSLITPEHVARAEEASRLWEDLVDSEAPLRLAIESLPWYGGLQQIVGRGLPFTVAVKGPSGEHVAEGWFTDARHANMLTARIMREAEG